MKFLGTRAEWGRFRTRMIVGVLCYAGGRTDLIHVWFNGVVMVFAPFVLGVIIGIIGGRSRDLTLTIVGIAIMSTGCANFPPLTYRDSFNPFSLPYFAMLLAPALLAFAIARPKRIQFCTGSSNQAINDHTNNLSPRCPKCGLPDHV